MWKALSNFSVVRTTFERRALYQPYIISDRGCAVAAVVRRLDFLKRGEGLQAYVCLRNRGIMPWASPRKKLQPLVPPKTKRGTGGRQNAGRLAGLACPAYLFRAVDFDRLGNMMVSALRVTRDPIDTKKRLVVGTIPCLDYHRISRSYCYTSAADLGSKRRPGFKAWIV